METYIKSIVSLWFEASVNSSFRTVLDGGVRRRSAVYTSRMAFVIVPLAKSARADSSAERSRSGVKHYMLTEPRPDLTTKTTHVANISFAVVVVMHSHVFTEIPHKSECTTADRAHIRFLARVNSLVGRQLWKEVKCLFASAAAVIMNFLIWFCKRRIMAYRNSILKYKS